MKSKAVQASSALRKKAERALRSLPPRKERPADPAKLIQELQIHEVELEMQNDELRLSEKRLGEVQKEYQGLYNEAPVGYVTLDERGMIVKENPLFTQMTGGRKSTRKKQFQSFLDREDGDKFHLHLRRAFQEGRRQTDEFSLIRADGSLLRVRLDSVRVHDGERQPLCHCAIADLTEEFKARTELEQSERRYRSLFENMLDGFAYCSVVYNKAKQPVDFVYLDVNPKFREFTGLSDVVGKPADAAIPGINWTNPEILTVCAQVSRTGLPQRFETYIASMQRWFSIAAYSPQMDHFVAVFTDTTRIKEYERSVSQFKRAVEQSPTSIVITDTNANVTYVNPKFSELTGYSREEILGKNIRILRSNQTPLEIIEGLWKEITAGREWRGEFCNKKKNGELYWETGTISPVRNDAGVITHFVSAQEDITEKKRFNEQIAQMERSQNERIGLELHDGLGAHLTGIRYLLDSIAHKAHQLDESEIGNDVTKCSTLLQESHDYIRGLARNYAQRSEPQGRLGEELRKFASTVQVLFGIECTVTVNDALDADPVSKTEIMHIVREAVNNAVRHGKPGKVWVKAHASEIVVENDGRDFPGEDGAQTGIGLVSMRQRAEALGGSIALSARPGGGTICRLLLADFRGQVKLITEAPD